jgi:hypothetical protein
VCKKALTLLCTLILLIPLLSLPFVGFASANFTYHPPIITVLSPVTNMAYDYQSNISLSVKVEMQNWGMTNSEELGEVKYSLDGQPDVAATVKNEIKKQGYGIEGFATATLSGVAEGAHSLFIHGQTTFSKSSARASFNRTIYFVVGTFTPTIQVLSPRQITYNSITVPLEYKSDKPLSWAGYSLDQKPVVTSLTKIVITNLFNGVHYLRVYGNDSNGNICASQEIVFTINGKKPPVVTIDAQAIMEARKHLPSDFGISC